MFQVKSFSSLPLQSIGSLGFFGITGKNLSHAENSLIFLYPAAALAMSGCCCLPGLLTSKIQKENIFPLNPSSGIEVEYSHDDFYIFIF